jgi:hypothetical protein
MSEVQTQKLHAKRMIVEALNPSFINGDLSPEDIQSIDLNEVFQARVREEMGLHNAKVCDLSALDDVSKGVSSIFDENHRYRMVAERVSISEKHQTSPIH